MLTGNRKPPLTVRVIGRVVVVVVVYFFEKDYLIAKR